MENPYLWENCLLDLAIKCGVPQEILRIIIEPLLAGGTLDVTRTSILKKGQGRAVVSIGGSNQGMILKLDRCSARVRREIMCLKVLNASPAKEHFPRLDAYGSVPESSWSYLLQEQVNGTPLSTVTDYFDCAPLIEQMLEVQSVVADQLCQRGVESEWIECLMRFAEIRLTSLLEHGTIKYVTYQRAKKVCEEIRAAGGSFPLLPIHGDLKPEHVYIAGPPGCLKYRVVDLADATFGDAAWDIAVLTLHNDRWMRAAVARMGGNTEEGQQGFRRRVELYQFIRTACDLDYAREFGLPTQGLSHCVEKRLSQLNNY